MEQKISPEDVLRSAGLRATPGRIQLIRILENASKPLTARAIAQKLGDDLNEVTLYRALDAFIEAKIVRRVDLRHDHAHYELSLGAHHHHAVCRKCGRIEDINVPHPERFEAEAQRRAKGFSIIEHYSLEFFGVCKKCA